MTSHRLSTSITSPLASLGPVGSDSAADMRVFDRPSTTDSTASSSAGGVSKASIESLIARHYTGLRSLISRRTGDPNIAADLVNEAVCTTWEKWQNGQIERPEQIVGYIFQVAINLLRNHRRRAAGRLETRINTGQYEAVAGGEKPAEHGIEDQMAERVKKLIRSMPTERDRLVLVRFYLQEEDKLTICRELGLDSLQFDKVLHRARLRLRGLLEAQGVKRSDLFSVLVLM